MKIKLCILLAILMTFMAGCGTSGESHRYPAEDGKHEGTWLIWPHAYTATNSLLKPPPGQTSTNYYSADVWVAMTKALHTGETVHIVAYDENEKAHIQKLLEAENVDMQQIDFFICPTNDTWVRDTGPIFVLDNNGKAVIANFRFDAWGGKQQTDLDNAIPQAVADAYGFDIIQIPELVLEGGAVELDGAGTLMAAKSSVVSANRNADKSLEEVEAVLSKYLGVTNFIWIEGVIGEDVTDDHIDGIAKFINDHQLFICSKEEYFKLYDDTDDDENDWEVLTNAKNAKGELYEHVYLPVTQNMVASHGQLGKNYGSYTNFYIGNEVVLVPQYNDPNDAVALEIIGQHYPGRKVVGIDCSSLLHYGGMIHCITQQQPQANAG